MTEETFSVYFMNGRRFLERSEAIIAASILAAVRENPVEITVGEVPLPTSLTHAETVDPPIGGGLIRRTVKRTPELYREPLNINGREFLTTLQAARFLGNVDALTLEAWRLSGRESAPAFVNDGNRALYDKAELQSWKARNRVIDCTLAVN